MSDIIRKEKHFMTKKQKENLALDIIAYLMKKDLFYDVTIYSNNKAYSSESNIFGGGSKEVKIKYEKSYYVTNDIDVTSRLEYCNPETVSMSFEGPLYDRLNFGSPQTMDDLTGIAKKYGLYPEQGNAWNLSFYE